MEFLCIFPKFLIFALLIILFLFDKLENLNISIVLIEVSADVLVGWTAWADWAGWADWAHRAVRGSSVYFKQKVVRKVEGNCALSETGAIQCWPNEKGNLRPDRQYSLFED